MNQGFLRGRRILLVRPFKADDPLLAMLQQAGAHLLHLPVLQIKPLGDAQPIKNCIIDFDNIDIAIFVSVNAARFALEWLDQYWPMLPQGVSFLAVGSTTAQVLRDFGCLADSPQLQSSEGLLAMPQLQQVAGKRITIFRGAGGRELLAETLRERGAQVKYCELYQRTHEAHNVALVREQLSDADALLVHSGELLQAVGDVRPLRPLEGVLVVPTERVAAIARELGYPQIEVAENATAEAMLSALKTIFGALN